MSALGRLFLIHWVSADAQELAARLGAEGWQVTVESEDGASAVRRIGDDPPDGVLIDLDHLPSHGREVAEALRRRAATRSIPILFVGGSGEALDRTHALVPDGLYTTSDNLIGMVNGLVLASRAADTGH